MPMRKKFLLYYRINVNLKILCILLSSKSRETKQVCLRTSFAISLKTSKIRAMYMIHVEYIVYFDIMIIDITS